MKKLVFAAAALGLISLTSCKKEYTCKCTTTVGSTSTSVQAKTAKLSKKDAKAACETTTSVPGASTKCELL